MISDVAIRNPVFSWMCFLAAILFGGISASRLGVSQLPDVDFPQLTITLNLEGAAPEVIEADVADVVEDAISTVEGVREISTTSKHGSCVINVEFELSRPIDLALQDVQSKLAQAQRRLPRELDPPVITKTNPEDQPIMWLGLSGPRPPGELADVAKNTLRPMFQTLPGVAEVMMGGYLERNVRVWLDARKLESYRLTAGDVVSAIGRQHVEVPAGRIESAALERNVRGEGEAPTVAEMRRIVVAEAGPDPVRLGDIAFVEDGVEDKRRVARLNGRPAVGFGIKKQRGANTVEVAREVKVRLEQVRRGLPPDLSLDLNFDSTPFIEESIREIWVTIGLAILLTALVCWVFLGSWSATFNVLLSIPTSIVGTFAAMYFLNFTLNTFTLLGLSLAVGIVVDDAIMVLESIHRHGEAGKDRVTAASEGSREIAFAALAATVAIMAIFLPVAFMKGVIGRFFYQFGVTISVAVALSLFEALTLTPMRCSRMLTVTERRTRLGRAIESVFRALAAAYAASLRLALAHPLIVVLASVVAFTASLGLVGRVGKELIPPQDQGIFLMRFQTPVGTSIERTDEVMRRAEAVVSGQPEVLRYFAAAGGFGGGDVNTGICFVTLKPRDERKRSSFEVMAALRKELGAFPDLRTVIADLSMRGFTSGSSRGMPVELSVRGPDWERLAQLSDQLMRRMRDSGIMTDTDWDYLVGAPEVRVLPVRERAADLGVDMREIGSALNSLIGGVRVARFTENGRRYDVRVRLVSEQRLRPQDIDRLFARSSKGELVRLDQVVRLKEEARLLQIQRKNRERAISIYANVARGATQADALAEVDRLAAEVLPAAEGYRIVYAGSAEAMQDTASQLLFAFVLGLIVAYMVLASQFNSYLHPVTVLLALPFAVTGAFVALYLTGKTLNLYSGIGLILLMGIVKKNSILLVDNANAHLHAGMDAREAMLAAGPIRLRPILMTSLATMAGAAPAALSFGPGAELRAPMAVAVLGGVAVSTFLTLFVVPAFYLIGESWIAPVGRAVVRVVLGSNDEAELAVVSSGRETQGREGEPA